MTLAYIIGAVIINIISNNYEKKKNNNLSKLKTKKKRRRKLTRAMSREIVSETSKHGRRHKPERARAVIGRAINNTRSIN